MVTTRSQAKSANHSDNDILKVGHNGVSMKCKNVQTYPILIKGKPVNIERDYCYPVKFTRCTGLAQIEEIWHEKSEVFIKASFFVTTDQLPDTEKCHNYGEVRILVIVLLTGCNSLYTRFEFLHHIKC